MDLRRTLETRIQREKTGTCIAYFKAMNVTDLIIIYLACGSPFGLHPITKRKPAPSGIDWVSVISSFVLWPLFAAALIAKQIFPNAERAEAEIHNRTEEIRLDIERLAFSGQPISSLFEFREVFYRFVGLSVASNAVSKRSPDEIFEISGHANKSLASRCLARRNSKRLAFHQERVSSEFADLISQISALSPVAEEIVGLAVGLTDDLGDISAKQRISDLPIGAPNATSLDHAIVSPRTAKAASLP